MYFEAGFFAVAVEVVNLEGTFYIIADDIIDRRAKYFFGLLVYFFYPLPKKKALEFNIRVVDGDKEVFLLLRHVGLWKQLPCIQVFNLLSEN